MTRKVAFENGMVGKKPDGCSKAVWLLITIDDLA